MNWFGIAYSLIGMTFGRALSLGGWPPTSLVGARVSYRQGGRSGSVVFSQGMRSFRGTRSCWRRDLGLSVRR